MSGYGAKLKPCVDCIWYDICEKDDVCMEFTPAADVNYVTDEELENGRIEFRKEWDEYVGGEDFYF